MDSGTASILPFPAPLFRVLEVDATKQGVFLRQARWLAERLTAGEVVSATFVREEDAPTLLTELLSIQQAHFDPTVRSYSQILLGEGGALFNWGTDEGDAAALLDLTPYPNVRRFLSGLARMSAALRQPGELLLLSAVLSLRRTSTMPRFYHRESHTSLQQLEHEGRAPSIYRMTCDLGLENSYEVINVNLVPRWLLLRADGSIRSDFSHLFQQHPIDLRLDASHVNVLQAQLTEQMLPFPETQRDLRPGKAFIWDDQSFFHAPYLRSGRSVLELQEKRRSIVIINEFRDNSFHDIDWSLSVRKLLSRIVGL